MTNGKTYEEKLFILNGVKDMMPQAMDFLEFVVKQCIDKGEFNAVDLSEIESRISKIETSCAVEEVEELKTKYDELTVLYENSVSYDQFRDVERKVDDICFDEDDFATADDFNDLCTDLHDLKVVVEDLKVVVEELKTKEEEEEWMPHPPVLQLFRRLEELENKCKVYDTESLNQRSLDANAWDMQRKMIQQQQELIEITERELLWRKQQLSDLEKAYNPQSEGEKLAPRIGHEKRVEEIKKGLTGMGVEEEVEENAFCVVEGLIDLLETLDPKTDA